MKKTKWLLIAAGIVALIAALVLCLTMCGRQGANDPGSKETGGADTAYTVTVKTDDGKPAPGVGIYVYEGTANGELVWYDKTADDGTMSFTAPASSSMVAVLDDLPTGYAAEEAYPITGENTEIILSPGVLSDEDMENIVYKLGDRMLDFTVTDTDGKEHTLSELLKTKKAVVLNFWFIGCGPCANEFPYLQSAYEKYSEDIEILAMNPMDRSESDIAAYKAEKKLTFPMVMADEKWAQMMNLAGYPTTVVIDRDGNICLIHKGAIEDAETFEQLFAHVTADTYESDKIGGIEDILTESTVGTSANPHTTDASKPFEITVKPGETYYLQLFKQSEKFYLTVNGGEFTLRYKDKDYKSEGGARTVYIQPAGVFVPVEIQITNTSGKLQTYTLSKSNPAGSYSNPYTLKLGEFSAKVAAGNDQGVYYTYIMPAEGTLSITCLSATAGVDYGFTLYNLNSYAQNILDRSESSDTTLQIQGKKGQKIQFVLNTLPDSTNSYPAGSFKLLAKLDEGKIKEAYKLPETSYTVKVVDEKGKAMSGVSITLSGSFTHVPPEGADEAGKEYPIDVSVNLSTGANGTAVAKQVSGPYNVTVLLPDGYKAETTQFSLTADKPTLTVKLQKIVQLDYTVTLTYPDGTPLTGAAVMLGSEYKTTNDAGSVSFHLDEGAYSVTVTGIPEGYVLPGNASTFAFPEGGSTLALTLVGVGGMENPYIVEQLPFATKALASGEKIYLRITAPIHYEDVPVLTVQDPDAVISYNGQDYTADPETGAVQVPLTASEEVPEVAIANAGSAAKSMELEITYPLGTKWNPEVIESLDSITVKASEGDEDGYYYQYLNDKAGDLSLQVTSVTPQGTAYELSMTTAKSGTVQITETAAAVYQKIGEAALIHIRALPVELPQEPGQEDAAPVYTYPAVAVTLSGSFEIDWDAVPDGQMVYTVTVQKPDGSGMSSVMVQFKKNGNLLAAVLTDSQGQARTMLSAGAYDVELALPQSTTKYYYEAKTAKFAAGTYDMTIKLVSQLPSTTTTAPNTYVIGAAPTVQLGSTYVTLQADAWKYFIFSVPEEGTYRISASDPDALVYNSGPSYMPKAGKLSGAARYYDLSVQKDQYKNTKYVVAVTGTEDTLLTITRIGDAAFDPAYAEPDYEWRTSYTPVASAIPTNVRNPKYVEIKDHTAGKYVVVFNEADQFYHMGSKNGPIIYLDLNDTTPYASVKVAVEGTEGSSFGSSFGRYFFDPYTGAFIRREVYDPCIREYVKVLRDAGKSYEGQRFYPLTHNLAYILQNGCIDWWTDTNNIYYESFQGYNPDIVWLFACCTFD